MLSFWPLQIKCDFAILCQLIPYFENNTLVKDALKRKYIKLSIYNREINNKERWQTWRQPRTRMKIPRPRCLSTFALRRLFKTNPQIMPENPRIKPIVWTIVCE